MNCSDHLLILVSSITVAIICFHVCPAIAVPDFVEYICDEVDGNYSTSSLYKENLHTLLSTITSNTRVDYGFYNVSVGQKLDEVYGIALCRGDIPTPDCKTCISNAAIEIISVCPNYKTAIGWYDNCTLWYSSQDIFFKGEMFLLGVYYLNDSHVAPNPKSFNHSLSTLMMKLAHKAAAGDSRLKFATGEANVSTTLTIHGLVQCLPDLEEFDCLFCLTNIINLSLAGCCYGQMGVRLGVPSCSIRYENYNFYKSEIVLSPLPSPTSPPPLKAITPTKDQNRSKRRNVAVGTIIILTVASLIAFFVVLLLCYIKGRKKKVEATFQNEDEGEVEMTESLQLDFNIVKAATNDFSDPNKIGEGGFGTVYKGIIASTGQVVAVKRLSKIVGQGEKEFKTEVSIVAKLRHRNLVKFLGYCLAKDEKLLVFEFASNYSLENVLLDPLKSKKLDWERRYKIIEGIARGLLYLHEESRLLVVHRDLKPSNVLLDQEMTPKISDFGMARLFQADQSQSNTRTIVGTYGYMPPEYVVHGVFSIKTDVFGFGVLILEIITGQKVSKFSAGNTGETLLSFAWRNWSEGSALKLVSSAIISGFNTSEVLRCIHIGLLCVQEKAARRPIMSSVVLMLSSYSMTLPVPTRPAFLAMPNEMNASINQTSLSILDPR